MNLQPLVFLLLPNLQAILCQQPKGQRKASDKERAKKVEAENYEETRKIA